MPATPRPAWYWYELQDDCRVTAFCVAGAADPGQYVESTAPDGTKERWRRREEGGLLVAVMSAGVAFRSDRTTTGFRDLVTAAGGEITALPDGSFGDSGTGIRTVLVTIPVAAREVNDGDTRRE